MRHNEGVPDPIVEIHDGVRYITCPYQGCNKRVKKMWNYYSHARTHTNQRPYVCSICKDAFKWQSSLKSHMRSHERRANGASSSAAGSSSRPQTSSPSSSQQTLPLPSVQALLGPDFHPRYSGSNSLPPAHQSRQHNNTFARSTSSPPTPIHPSHSSRAHRGNSHHSSTSSTRGLPRARSSTTRHYSHRQNSR